MLWGWSELMGITWLAFKNLRSSSKFHSLSDGVPHLSLSSKGFIPFHPPIFWSSPSPHLQISSLVFFFFVLLRKTDPLEINSYVANMKQILSIGEETIVSQFFQATIWHPLSDSGCCSIFKKSLCEWVVLSLQRFLCVGACMCFSSWLCRNTPWEGNLYHFRSLFDSRE